MTWLAGRPAGRGGPRRRAKLRSDGAPVVVGSALITSPGLAGDAEAHPPGAAPAAQRWTREMRRALAGQHMETRQVVELSHTREVMGQPGRDRIVTPYGEAALRLDLPDAPPGSGQVLLASDESGTLTWHTPFPAPGADDLMRTGGRSAYAIRRWVAPPGGPTGRRSLVNAFGGKVLSSLVFPFIDPVFGAVGERFAATWETMRRPYRFRSFTPDDYRQEAAGDPDWDHLAGGRALMFVHGTFSRAHTGFGALPTNLVESLSELYDGRVFAFDHFTLSHDPRQNIDWFFDHLPDGIGLELDIVSHSRGGLVSRVLAESPGDRDRAVSVKRVVFTATPNAGTVLTMPAHLGDLIDMYTNILNLTSGSPVVDVLEGVLTVLKHVAVGATSGLSGLRAMQPGGEFLASLNRRATNSTRYFAITGDYEPQSAGWRKLAVDRVMDLIFKEANDLVVPTAGTWEANGSSHFPVVDRHQLEQHHGVDHSGYFANDDVGAALMSWLRPGSG